MNENTSEGGLGGGLSVGGTATLQRCTVSNNTTKALGGGAIYNSGNLTVESCTLASNTAASNGGAILADLPSPTTTVRGSTFSNNKSSLRGGAISNAGTLGLTNCTLSANNANILGGGLYNFGGKSTVVASTFFANVAQQGGGIYASVGASSDRFIKLRNCLFQKGISGGNLAGSGGITSQGFNLSSDDAGGDAGTGSGGFLNGVGDQRNRIPNLGALQNNGGPTLTHAPISPSPAIDTGDDSLLDAPTSLMTDGRGPGFPRRIGLQVDIGAVETGINLTVTTTDDHDDGAVTPADCTLREAINATNAAGGGTITFAPGVRGTIQLAGALPDIQANLLLQGPGKDFLTVRRNTGGDYSIFVIRNGTANGPSASIAGLTIKDGQAPPFIFPYNSGGGILNDRGSLLVKDCTIANNRSSPSNPSSVGGGIFNYEGFLSVDTSTISGNQAPYGGGIASSRANPGTTEVYVNASTISGNSCPGGGGAGGGIYHGASGAGSASRLTVRNCTLSGNSAGSSFVGTRGGGLITGGDNSGMGEAMLADCTFSDNNADAGSAIYNNNFSAASLVTLRNTLLKIGTSGGSILNANGTITSLGNNLCSDEAGSGASSGTGPGGYLNGPGDIRNTDPLLGPLQDNGGPTFTHALLPGSPAINAGTNDDAPTDQRGFLPVGTNDIGAFEFSGIRLQIRSIARSGNDIAITFNAVANQTFHLERKLSLADTVWQSVPGVLDLNTTSAGDAQFVDPGALSLGKAFYRVTLVLP